MSLVVNMPHLYANPPRKLKPVTEVLFSAAGAVAPVARSPSKSNVTGSACAPNESVTSAAAAVDFKNAVFMFCTC
jgi:hypothetical protein